MLKRSFSFFTVAIILCSLLFNVLSPNVVLASPESVKVHVKVHMKMNKEAKMPQIANAAVSVKENGKEDEGKCPSCE